MRLFKRKADGLVTIEVEVAGLRDMEKLEKVTGRLASHLALIAVEMERLERAFNSIRGRV